MLNGLGGLNDNYDLIWNPDGFRNPDVKRGRESGSDSESNSDLDLDGQSSLKKANVAAMTAFEELSQNSMPDDDEFLSLFLGPEGLESHRQIKSLSENQAAPLLGDDLDEALDDVDPNESKKSQLAERMAGEDAIDAGVQVKKIKAEPVNPDNCPSMNNDQETKTQLIAQKTLLPAEKPQSILTPKKVDKPSGNLDLWNLNQSELWNAARQGDLDLAMELIKSMGEPPDFNESPTEGPDKGKTILWLVANEEENEGPWVGGEIHARQDLLQEMLSKPSCNVNASPPEGPDKGKTVMWLCANKGGFNIFRVADMLLFPNADVNASPAEGPDKGKTVLWLVANFKRNYPLFEKGILKIPNADVNASPAEGPDKGKSVLWLIAKKAAYHHYEARPDGEVSYTRSNGEVSNNGVWFGRLEEMLKLPGADLNAAPVDGPDKGVRILILKVKAELIYALSTNNFKKAIEIFKEFKSIINPDEAVGAVEKGFHYLLEKRINVWTKKYEQIKVWTKKYEQINLFDMAIAMWEECWELIDLMRECYPEAKGLNRVFNKAAENGQFELVEKLLEAHRHVDVNSIDEQTSPLCHTALACQWRLLARMLELRPNCGINTSLNKKNPLQLASVSAPDEFLKLMIIHMMNWDTPGVHLHTQLFKLGGNLHGHTKGRVGQLVKDVSGTFYHVASVIPDFTKPPKNAKGFQKLIPKDIRWIIALDALRVLDPHFVAIPNENLKRLLLRFKSVVIHERQGDVVACQVLEKFYPIAERGVKKIEECQTDNERKITTQKKARMQLLRTCISKEITGLIINGNLPEETTVEQRQRLVEVVTNRKTGLRLDKMKAPEITKYFKGIGLLDKVKKQVLKAKK